MRQLLFILMLLPIAACAQNNIFKGAGISYTVGVPTYAPGTRGAEVAIDTATGYWYEYNQTTAAWSHSGYRIQSISGCVSPAYTPGKMQSYIVVNGCDSLYYYRAGAWRHLNAGGSGGGLDWTVSGATDSTYYLTPSAGTDQNVALVPKGSGGLLLSVPDGTASGGNARGVDAVDLQRTRTNADQVASGGYSAVVGGYSNKATTWQAGTYSGHTNTASGESAVTVGGNTNSATAENSAAIGGDNNTAAAYASAIVGGYNGNTTNGSQAVVLAGNRNAAGATYSVVSGNYGTAYVRGQVVVGSGTGGYQSSKIVMHGAITGTATTEIFATGSNNARIVLANGGTTNRAYNANVRAVAICAVQGNGTVTAGEMYAVTKGAAIKLVGGTTAIVGAVQTIMAEQEDTNMAGADIVASADDTNDALKIEFTPPTAAGTTSVFRVMVTVELSEVGY